MKILLFLIITALGCSMYSGGGPDYYFNWYFFINLPPDYNSSAKTSICLTYQFLSYGNVNNITSSFGAQDCRGIAEVVLVGRYIHLGLHNQGSFGTQICMYYPFTILPSAFGLLVDYDRNGFNSENASLPGYVGNLAIAPRPVEGDR